MHKNPEKAFSLIFCGAKKHIYEGSNNLFFQSLNNQFFKNIILNELVK